MTPTHSQPAAPLSAPAIVRATVRAAGALVTRQLLGHGLNAAGAVALANLFSVEEFGIYAIVVLIWSVLYVISDVGLGAALVRQGEEPEPHDYRSVFTAQLLMMTTLLVLVWPLAPLLAAPYARAGDVAFIMRMAALALLPACLQTVPSIRLERHLRFERLALVEVGQALVFNLTAVALAWAGRGAAVSLGAALLARKIGGAVLAQAASPWAPGWHFSWNRLRGLLAFGVPFQGVGVVALGKDAFIPVVAGVLAGEAAVGLLTWASWVARAPVLALFMMQRVYLPAFSRMLEHRGELARFVENVLFTANAAVAPLAVLVLLLSEHLPALVFGKQWQSAVPLVLPYWLAMLPLATAFPLFGLLGALGHARTAFVLAATQAAAVWLLGAPLTAAFGATGAAWASVLAAPAIAAAVPIARRSVDFDVARAVVAPWSAALVCGGALLAMRMHWPVTSVAGLMACSAAALVVYGLTIAMLAPSRARTMLSLLTQAAAPKRATGPA
ncbi:MAG TPA: oligosaccharide flippase family protein [Candidatus Binatia bacterium]|nr:oligosaccharide flippase family protein [Candidatus Binatia bacterium]